MKKRSLSLNGHRTSIALEEVFWRELENIAQSEGLTMPLLIERIDRTRTRGLASALRVYVVDKLALRSD